MQGGHWGSVIFAQQRTFEEADEQFVVQFILCVFTKLLMKGLREK